MDDFHLHRVEETFGAGVIVTAPLGAHAADLELANMLKDKGVLHFRLFAKYAAAFFRMTNSSAYLATCRFNRTFSRAKRSSIALHS